MRARARRNCGCRKVFFKTYEAAQRVVNRTDAEHVYFCAEAGGYHITKSSRDEFNQQQATKLRERRVQRESYMVI